METGSPREHRNDPGVMQRLLTTPAPWAVVGLSENRERPAYGVARYMQNLGLRIVPVHPKAETVHGARGYRTLSEAQAAEGPIAVADLFVNSALVGDVVDEAIALGIKAVWLQLGVIDQAAAARAAAAGLDVVMNTCPAIEAPRLGVA
ncbi:CoA-binding protein [Kineosporia babensis]|uniref:CoA-binding protein n=1 Tax=Kineosporia babensis TaxID=499548 RepID=A0A9X1NGJ0_9ACTN|nr:CoA-binding protein [Kineosporia babensis]MCD5313625.1 CoA-binding protein [Kineosporia babensis]